LASALSAGWQSALHDPSAAAGDERQGAHPRRVLVVEPGVLVQQERRGCQYQIGLSTLMRLGHPERVDDRAQLVAGRDAKGMLRAVDEVQERLGGLRVARVEPLGS